MAFPPRVIRAKGADSQPIKLALCVETWSNAVRDGDTHKLGQFLALVQTGVPHLDADVGLLRAHAFWQGLQRPLRDDVSGPDHYAYILKPRQTYELLPDNGSHTLVPSPAPEGSVFMVTVEIPTGDDPRLAQWGAFASDKVVGLVEDWAWFRADRREPDQPQNPSLRFEFRHW